MTRLGWSWIGACAFSAAVAGSAAAMPPKLTERQAIQLGRSLAARNCGMCHALDPIGASPNPQAPPFRALSDRFDVELLGEGLATGILTQHPAMPEFRFEPYEVVAIVRYLRSVQERRRTNYLPPPLGLSLLGKRSL